MSVFLLLLFFNVESPVSYSELNEKWLFVMMAVWKLLESRGLRVWVAVVGHFCVQGFPLHFLE